MANIAGEILNVYHYRVRTVSAPTLISDDPEGWAQAFSDSVMDACRDIQTNGVNHVRIDINNLMAYATDFTSLTYVSPLPGLVAQEYTSAATAWSYQLIRTTRVTRHGHKRIAGVPESWVNNNVLLPANAALVNGFSANLQSPIVMTVDGTVLVQLDPVIIRKGATVGVPPTAVNLVSDAAYRGIGSQNTRKQLLA